MRRRWIPFDMSASVWAWAIDHAGLAVLSLARPWGAFLLLPIIAPTAFPRQVRWAIPLAITPAVFWARAQGGAAPPEPGLGLLFSIVAELWAGFIITLPAAVFVWAAGAAGALLDTQTGASNNEVFNPMTGSQEGPASLLLTQFAIIGFVGAGGLLEIVRALWHSAAHIPVAADFVQPGMFLTVTLSSVEGVMTTAIRAAAPLLALFLATEATIALAGKFAPQLNVSAIAAPIKSLLLPAGMCVMVALPAYFGAPQHDAIEQISQYLRVFVSGR